MRKLGGDKKMQDQSFEVFDFFQPSSENILSAGFVIDQVEKFHLLGAQKLLMNELKTFA